MCRIILLKRTTDQKSLPRNRKEDHGRCNHECSDCDGNVRHFTRMTAGCFDPCRLLCYIEPLKREREDTDDAKHEETWQRDRLLNVCRGHRGEQDRGHQRDANTPNQVEHRCEGYGNQRDGHGIHLQVLAPHNDNVEGEPEDVDGEQQGEDMEDDREGVLPLADRARVRAPNACRVDAVYGRRQSSIPNAPAYVHARAVVKDRGRITFCAMVTNEASTRKICSRCIGEARTADEGEVLCADESCRRGGRGEIVERAACRPVDPGEES